MDERQPVVVYTTANELDAEVVRAALEAEGIQALVTGQNQAGLAGVLQEVAVEVPAQDAERARQVLAEHTTTTAPGEADEEEDEAEGQE